MHKAGRFLFVCAGLLGLAFLLPRSTAAAWPSDPFVNVPVCTAIYDQSSPTVVSDGAGGAIVTWCDTRSGTSYDIYAQRISVDGTLLWAADGVALCTARNHQNAQSITPDGAGGAIVAWEDWRGGQVDIFAQRISADGTVLWTADGVALCTATNDQGRPTITGDGAGGAIVTWEDWRGGQGDIYAQRILANGTVQWPTDGVGLCTNTDTQRCPTIAPDGAGGAIVTWEAVHLGHSNIYTQRISAAGTVQWRANGVTLSYVSSGDQVTPTIISDGAGGAIVTWCHYYAPYDIHAQRISADGKTHWLAGGVPICPTTGDQFFQNITSDGVGGAIIAWTDTRNGNRDIYAQRISAAGTVQWPTTGVAICTAANNQSRPIGVSDGAGGAIVTWGGGGLHAQRISAAGTVQWMADGVTVCAATSVMDLPTIASNSAGGAIVTWVDYRSGTYDIYAQNVNADGTLGDLPTPVLLSLVSADVTADGVKLAWFMGGSGSDVATVYRSPVGGEWTRIGEITANGSGYLRYSDPIIDVTASRVGYRLGIVDAGVEGFYGETWVDLPARGAALAFALDPVRPNPTQGGALAVHFTLPGAAPARIELVDVSGRRVVEREVGSLGAGRHTLDLDEGRRLAPGMAW